jgi:S-DNA-T family DNA segregation ATPase FtsK/SpoIIIE
MRRDAGEREFTDTEPVNDDLLPSRRATAPAAYQPQQYPVTAGQSPYQGYVHPHQVLPEHFTNRLDRRPGGQRTLRPFQYLNDIHAWPGIGALAFTGAGFGVHGQAWHEVIGGAMLGLGFIGLGFSGIAHLSATANQPHSAGEEAAQPDVHITRGAALLGIGAIAGGTACAAGPTWISFMMLVPELAAGYIGWHLWRHHKVRHERADIISYTAAANPGAPMPPVGVPAGIPMPGSLPQIVSWEASRLHDAFEDLGISPITIRAIVEAGPDAHTATIALPSGSNTSPDAIMRKKQQLVTNLGCRHVEIVRGNSGNEIELTWFDGEDHLADTVLWPGPSTTSFEEPIPLGLFENLQTVEQSLLWNHTLIAGDTDNGKSGVMNVIVCSTLPHKNVVRIGIDCKPGAPELGPYRKVMWNLATSPEQGMRSLRGLLAVIKVRGQSIGIDEYAILDDDDIDVPVRKWDTKYGPYILAPIDELAELTSEFPNAAKWLRRIRQIGRYVGVFCLDATQYPEKEVFGSSTAARKQYQVRIGLHCSETGTINVILGAGAQGKGWRLDELRHKGSFMIKSREHAQPRAARAYYITDQMIADMVNRWAPECPTLDDLSASAFREAYDADLEAEDDGPAGPGGGHGIRGTEAGDTRGESFRLHVVPTVRYPDGTVVEQNWQRLWKEFSTRPNASVDELVDLRIERLTSRDSVRKALRAWILRGYAWTDDAGKYYPNPDINRREA